LYAFLESGVAPTTAALAASRGEPLGDLLAREDLLTTPDHRFSGPYESRVQQRHPGRRHAGASEERASRHP
jgi:hypothetical protein